MENEGSSRGRLSSLVQLWMTLGIMMTNTTSANSTSIQERESNNCDNRRPWETLPEELLDMISSHLKIPDYISFGRVCEKWRSFYFATHKSILRAVPPLVCYISAWDQNTCLLYDIPKGDKYQITLPYFATKFCIGLSSGHIILGEMLKNFWFINPVTGYQHIFSSLPRYNYRMSHNDRFILAATGPNQDITLIMVLSQIHHCIWFRRSIDTQWSTYNFAGKAWISDMVVFRGRVYAITTRYQIGVLSLRSSEVRFLNLRFFRCKCFNPRFVTSNDQLYVVDFVPYLWFQMFKIDFSIMAWVRVDNLGDEALFLGEMMGIGIRSTARWGGRGNCAYYLPLGSNKVHVHSCTTAGYLGSFPIIGEDRFGYARLKCWYFVDQSYNVDYVKDE